MSRCTAILLLSLAVVTTASAGVKHIPISKYAYAQAQSSNPSGLTRFGDYAIFTANDAAHGTELWRTDGTLSGTTMIADLAPGTAGSSPRIVGQANGRLIFTVWTSPTTSAWRTDGTTAGTTKIADLPATYSSRVAVATNRLFAISDGYPLRIWSVDLTTGESSEFAAGFSLYSSVVAWGSNIYFAASDPVIGTQLWTSDGTPEGTHLVRRGLECPGPGCGLAPLEFFNTGGRLCFRTQAEIWSTDGSAEGTVRLAQCANARLVAAAPAAAYVSCDSGLWRTDGTPAGTRPAGPAQSTRYGKVLDDGSLIFITQISSGSTSTFELWKSNGTTSSKMSTLPFTPTVNDPMTYGTYADVGALGTKLLLPGAATAYDSELWSVDVVTGAAALVKEIDPRPTSGSVYASNPYAGVTFGSRIVFPATNALGRELWETDGTTDGTRLLDNIAADSTGGKLSGTVRDAATGAPLANVKILLCWDSRCYSPDVAFSRVDGTYSFEPMATGSAYRVFAQAASYVSQAWPAINCGDCPLRSTPYGYLSPAGTLSIVGGMETTGVDFSLVRGGSITVKAHSVTTGQPVTYFATIVRSVAGDVMQYLSPTPPSQTATSVPLAPGDYYVETLNTGWGMQVFDGHDCPASGCDYRVGEPIAVSEGLSTQIELALKDQGRIAGRVVEAITGLPVSGATIRFQLSSGNVSYYTTTTTDGTGQYVSPPMPNGNCYVSVPQSDNGALTGVLYPNLPCDSSCPTAGATAVPVTTATTTTGIDMTVTRRSGWGRISGRITDRDGLPLAEAPIGFFAGSETYTYRRFTTAADGGYSIYLAPATYRMVVFDEAYPGGVFCSYYDCPNIAGALPIEVTDGSTAILNMQIGAKRSTFSGKISDAASGNFLYSTVSVLNGLGRTIGTTTAYSETGRYSISFIGRDDPLYVRVSSDDHRPGAYGDVPWPCPSTCTPPAGATPISAGDRKDIDVRLQPYGSITGRVTDIETGLGLSYVNVTILDPAGNLVSTVSTDYYGRFKFSSADGSYYLSATAYGYLTQIYRDTTCAASCDISQGVAVTSTSGSAVEGIDFHLQPVRAGVLSGRVVDDLTGNGVPGVAVATGAGSTSTDSNGNYTIRGLATQLVQVSASPSAPYFFAYYGGINCVDSAGCNPSSSPFVQVTSPNTTSGVDFRLIRIRVTSVQPASGFTIGGTEVHITGANFTSGAAVTIGGKDATVISRSPAEIVVLTPPSSAASPVHVVVKNTANVYVTAGHAFTYVAAPFVIAAHSSPEAISINTTLPAGTTSAALFRREHGTTGWTAIPWSGPGGADPTNPSRGVVYDYHVEATVSGALQISNVASSILFTDDPIVAGETVIKRCHFTELRDAINAYRASAGLGPMPLDAAVGSMVFAQDINALRMAINQARTVLGLGSPAFSDAVIGVGMPIRAAHIQELRSVVR